MKNLVEIKHSQDPRAISFPGKETAFVSQHSLVLDLQVRWGRGEWQ